MCLNRLTLSASISRCLLQTETLRCMDSYIDRLMMVPRRPHVVPPVTLDNGQSQRKPFEKEYAVLYVQWLIQTRRFGQFNNSIVESSAKNEELVLTDECLSVG